MCVLIEILLYVFWHSWVNKCSFFVVHELSSNMYGTMQDGATPLDMASFDGHLEVCSVLIEAGACVNAQRKVSAL